MNLPVKEALRMDKLRMATKEFKKHYKRAMRLKEGGAAWEREITLAERYKAIAKKEYEESWKVKYCF